MVANTASDSEMVIGGIIILMVIAILACVWLAAYIIGSSADPHDHARFEERERQHDPELDHDLNIW